MGLFDKFFGKKKKVTKTHKPAEDPVDNQFPLDAQIIEGQLSVKLFNHKIAINHQLEFDTLAYVTNGFAAVGQRELVLFIKHEPLKPGEFLEAPLHFFHDIYQLAVKGQIVHAGGRSIFGEKGFMGHSGILYVAMPDIAHEYIPEDALAMVLVHRKEADVIEAFGSMRLLTMLGRKYRYYPCPYWSDFQREELPIDHVLEKTMLGKMPALSLSIAHATMENKKVVLSIPSDTPITIARENIPHNPIAVLTGLPSHADFCFVWSVDAPDEHNMIGCPTEEEGAFYQDYSSGVHDMTLPKDKMGDSIIGGCCLIITPEQSFDRAQILEDGFGILMKDQTWDAFWTALIDKKPFEMKPTDKGMGLKVKWI